MPSNNDFNKLYAFVETRVEKYNRPEFVESDPVFVPHQFKKKQDIEIAALFAATFAWGLRKTIINKGLQLMALMDNAPHAFCVHHSDHELKRLLFFAILRRLQPAVWERHRRHPLSAFPLR